MSPLSSELDWQGGYHIPAENVHDFPLFHFYQCYCGNSIFCKGFLVCRILLLKMSTYGCLPRIFPAESLSPTITTTLIWHSPPLSAISYLEKNPGQYIEPRMVHTDSDEIMNLNRDCGSYLQSHIRLKNPGLGNIFYNGIDVRIIFHPPK